MSEVAFPDHIRLSTDAMDEAEAHSVVRAIKFHGVRMCQELVRAHDGQAWIALGHDSWGTFCEQVLKISRQRANQLVKSARNQSGLALMFEVAVESIDVPERWIRGVTIEQLQPMVETAVSTLPPDAPYDQRASAIVGAIEQYHREHHAGPTKVTKRRSESTTTEFSSGQDPAPGADDSGGEAPSGLPAATLPDAGTREGRGDRDGDEGQPDALRDREPASTPGSGGAVGDAPAPEDHAGEAPDVEATQDAESSPSSPASDPEPVLDGLDSGSGSLDKAQVSTAFAAALTLLTIDPKEAAGLLVGDERDDRAADCERIVDWLLSHHDAVVDRTLRSVTA